MHRLLKCVSLGISALVLLCCFSLRQRSSHRLLVLAICACARKSQTALHAAWPGTDDMEVFLEILCLTLYKCRSLFLVVTCDIRSSFLLPWDSFSESSPIAFLLRLPITQSWSLSLFMLLSFGLLLLMLLLVFFLQASSPAG